MVQMVNMVNMDSFGDYLWPMSITFNTTVKEKDL